jgi:hypothetical protein
MSQPSTPFNNTAADPFLSSMDQEQQLAQADFEKLFGSDHPVFSSNYSEVLDELDFSYDNASVVHVDSSNPSTISTPDFSSYNFGQQSSAYPTPLGPNSPHPYPLERQQTYQTTSSQLPFNHRSLPHRSQTNNTSLHPAQPPQGYGRRRSLSYGDVDRIAAAPPNPTFIRLQAPRARSTTPEDKRRGSPYPQHGASASQGPGPRGRPRNPTSIPYAQHGNLLIRGMLPTPIGTPLNEMMEVEDLRYGYQDNGTDGNGLTFPEGPVFQHMTRPEELARSRQIIQIGAMAVKSRSTLDPQLMQTGTNDRERILKKLADIEAQLNEKKGEEALGGCRMIREALGKKLDADEVTHTVEDNNPAVLGAPSKLDCSTYGDGSELKEMLMRQNGVHPQDQEDESSDE